MKNTKYMRLYALPWLIFLSLIIAAPLVSVLIGSFNYVGGFLFYYQKILTSKFYLNSFIATIELSLLTSFIGMIFAIPICISLRSGSAFSQRFATAFANLGSNFAGVPSVMAFIILLGVNGVLTKILIDMGIISELNIYSFFGLVLTYCFFQISLAIVLLLPVMVGLPKDIEEAAFLIGTTKSKFWWFIGLPIIFRQLVAVSILLFANAMGTYATAFTLVGTNARIVTVRIGELVTGDVFANPGLANALSICLLIVLLVPIAVNQLVGKRGH